LSNLDRLLLSKLSRASKAGLISVPAAAEAFGTSRSLAAKRLAALARRRWLLRVRRGLYLVLPLEAEPGQRTTAEDPWILASVAFAPCYIGGWSAAEHWGLTEQIFRPTLVITAANVRSRTTTLAGHVFRLFRLPAWRVSGSLVPVWRGTERVQVSSRERTIVDCLRDPELCGGVRSLVEIMMAYAESPERDFGKLGAAARESANGAAWKRLGYIAESLWPREVELLDEAKRHLTKGTTRLDPSVRGTGRLVARWRLWLNVPIHAQKATA
jgi:predicted transcriptional regulator of viral defense system